MSAIVFDTEVNSLDAKEVIELAHVECYFVGDKLEYGEIESGLFKPSQPFEAGAVAIHGITPFDVEACDDSSKASIPEAEFIIAHNVDFDAEVMKITNAKRICTLALSRHLWPEYKSHTLSALFLELFGMTPANVKILRSAHTASVDVKILMDVLDAIVAKLQVKTMDELHQKSEAARVPTHMPYGKHKGALIADVPRDYVQWLLKQSDVCPYLRIAMSAR